MTRNNKQTLTMVGVAIMIFCTWITAGPISAASIVTTIVTDPLTGVAIDGYDPVSYFTDPEPAEGKPDFEYYWGGVPWYFANAANRDVFISHPEIYAPRFGGYCAMSLARGFLSDGNPRIYLIEGQQLFLFYSTGNRDAFMLSAHKAATDAEANWPALEASLVSQYQRAAGFPVNPLEVMSLP